MNLQDCIAARIREWEPKHLTLSFDIARHEIADAIDNGLLDDLIKPFNIQTVRLNKIYGCRIGENGWSCNECTHCQNCNEGLKSLGVEDEE